MNISKKTLVLIPSTIALAIGIVALLAWRAIEPLSKSSKFERRFIPSSITQENVMANEGLMGIIGTTNTNYFFQTKDPSAILVTDHNLTNKQIVRVQIPGLEKLQSTFYSFVDSPYITILAGGLSLAIETQIDSKTSSVYKFPTTLFTRGIKIGPHSYVIRGVDTLVKRFDQIFIKGNSEKNSITKEKNVSETNKDGGISTDGFLCFDPINQLVIYQYYYESKFLVIDSNMNLKYTGRTIDKSKSFPIKSTVNKNVLSASTPKRLVNDYCTVSNGYLFTNSMIKSNNEKSEEYEKNTPVDVYSVNAGNYVGTFYVPKYRKERMRRFKIYKDNLIAFYKSNIVCYRINLFSEGKEITI